ncbi:conserved hypothetical protein [Candidatus Sulfopaludibacter sp. SbA4]|nr:conserved hypothetical protein [Candidatus Sulfopaludibacter sp. SbA4]
MTVQVEAYSGFLTNSRKTAAARSFPVQDGTAPRPLRVKADERPLRFRLGDRWYQVEEVLDRWYDPDAIYFRVRADDRDLYVLRHSAPEDVWTLEAYRRAASRESG